MKLKFVNNLPYNLPTVSTLRNRTKLYETGIGISQDYDGPGTELKTRTGQG